MNSVDICLVNPPFPAPSPYNLAIPYLSANLKKHGLSTKIVDATALRICPDELAELVAGYNPRFVGVSVFASQRVRPAQKTLTALKKRMPDVTVVCGGIMATLCPEEFAPRCDLVVTGPGEQRLVDIVRTAPGVDVFDFPGVAWFDHGNEKLHVNPAEPLSDLDSLPFPDWDGVLEDLSLDRVFDWNEISYKKESVIPVLSSRGCPFRCAFCSNWILSEKKVLRRSAENVVEEIRYWKERLGVSLFHFCDDNFGYDPKHVAEVCDAITDANLDIRWRCTISANAAIHEPTIRKLKKAGCARAFLGAESGDPEILKGINKPIKLPDVQRGVALLMEAGIPTTTSFILGLPGDTQETVLKTMKFAAGLHASELSLWIANPMPGTKMWEMAVQDGGMLDTVDVFDPSPTPVRYLPPGLRGWDLKKLQLFFYSYWAGHNLPQAARYLASRREWKVLFRLKVSVTVVFVLLNSCLNRILKRPLRFPRWARCTQPRPNDR